MVTKSRPPIPAELRRRVLLESGHRCAIHVCRFPDVDVHHIVPWSKCKEHQFENLIALCPNCHRRAHNGEIDRKSLLHYKYRLSALYGRELLEQLFNDPAFDIEITPKHGNYKSELLYEKNDEKGYLIDIEYPVFEGQEYDKVNEIVRRKVKSQKAILENAAENERMYSAAEFYVKAVSYIGLDTGKIISLRSYFGSYIGGAHGSSSVDVLNYRFDKSEEFSLEDMFSLADLAIMTISSYSIREILKNPAFASDERSVRDGAGPKKENFEDFNLTPDGLLVYFREYQVGCYAVGSIEVLIPYSILRQFGNDFFESILEGYQVITHNKPLNGDATGGAH